MNLERISKRQAALMATLYRRQEKAVKTKLLEAVKRGNDRKYLDSVLKSIQDDVKVLERYNENYANKVVPKVYVSAEKQTDLAIEGIEKEFDLPSSFGKPSREALSVLANNTFAGLAQTTQIIGRRTDDVLRQIGLEQTRGIIFGTDSWKSVARKLEEEIKANNFLYVPYKRKDGTTFKYPVRAYSEMVARTTSAEAFRQGTTNRISQRGYDLVLVIGISQDPKSPCIPYQGKTLSISGKTEGYTSLESARANGFNHPNCIHSLGFSDENIKFLEDENYKPVGQEA